MSNDIGIGRLIEGEAERDAIHVAVAPVVAAYELMAGEHVALTGNMQARFCDPGSSEAVGIVDPFLTRTVQPGERFWLFLYPGTITSLRHSWTHPAFFPKAAREHLERKEKR